MRNKNQFAIILLAHLISTTLNKTVNHFSSIVDIYVQQFSFRDSIKTEATFILSFHFELKHFRSLSETMFFRDKVAKVSLGDMLEIQERLGTKK